MRVLRRDVLFRRTESVSRLEAQDVHHGDAIQATADSPHRQHVRIDELVDGLATELPAAAQLGNGQPGGIDRYRVGPLRLSSVAR